MLYREPCSSTLQKFVRERLSLIVIPGHCYENEVKGWSIYLLVEKENILYNIRTDILKMDADKKIELYIDSQQAYFSDLINEIVHFHEAHDQEFPQELNIFYTELADQLQSVLTTIQRDFVRYFDLTRDLPLSQWKAARLDARMKVEAIRRKLQKPTTEQRLIDVAVQPYEDWYKTDHAVVNYKQLMYANQYLQELLEVDDNQKIDCQLRNKLVEINFNSPGFFNYSVLHFNEILDNIPRLEMLEKLKYFEKIFSQFRPRVNMRFSEANPPTNEFLLNLVLQERLFTEYIEQIHASQFKILPPGEQEADSSTLYFDKSLGVLSALHRVMYELKVTKAKTVTDAIRFVWRNYKTNNSRGFTYDSAKQKWYNIDSVSKEGLIDLLHDMLKVAHKVA